MKAIGAHFFGYVQSAGFYRELHRRAVQLLPEGNGGTWFDVGTGPGLVARLAAAHGYRVTGFDVDHAMIGAARASTHERSGPAAFEVAALDALAASGRKANVVSAASLLAVMGDKGAALRALMACVEAGGTLLVIETTARMKPLAALAWLGRHGWRARNWVLLLWAWARRRQAALDLHALARQGYRVEHADVFAGMVSAWTIRRRGD